MIAAVQSPNPPELLEPARAQPDFDAMDDMGDYAAVRGRESLEGGLWVEVNCPVGNTLVVVQPDGSLWLPLEVPSHG